MKHRDIFCFILILLASAVLSAETRQLAPNLFAAGIPTEKFNYVAENQGSQNWCWAACVEMIFKSQGLQVEQEQAVLRVYGGLIDRPATSAQVIYALNGWAPDSMGGMRSVWATNFVMNPMQIIDSLHAEVPLIAEIGNPQGGVGHAVVITAVYYSLDNWGNRVITGVVVRDPWPLNPSRQEYSWPQFSQQLRGLILVYVN